MITIPDIAGTLKTNREAFGRVFLQAQLALADPGKPRRAFEDVAEGIAEPECYTVALEDAKLRGFLDRLVDLIITERLEDGNLSALYTTEGANAGDPSLQAIVNQSKGFAQPLIHIRRYNDAIRWTCQVFIDKAPRGTGVLIRPNLVLTAWHVVRDLFDEVDGTYQQQPESGARLTVQFDNALNYIGRRGTTPSVHPLTVKAIRDDWCVTFSPCHKDELLDRFPADLGQLKGRWDYAIIRLADSPGLQRRWANTDRRFIDPPVGEPVTVLQHPDGQMMRVDEATIVGIDEATMNSVRSIRFLHNANAAAGSSGGPCFDRGFELFGFHQGRWSNGPPGGDVINRGIPMLSVLDHIKQTISDFPPLSGLENPAWTLGETQRDAPVIARCDFQEMVWKSAVGGKPKVILVRGPEGSGKSFCLDLLTAILPISNHLVVALDAASIASSDATTLVDLICRAAGTTPPSIAPASEMDSTTSVWLADEVLHKLIQTLNDFRIERTVWITIRNLNHNDIVLEDTADLLGLLYKEADRHDWLRVVLDGPDGEVLPSTGDEHAWYTTKTIVQSEVETYFHRVNAEWNLGIEDLSIKAVSTVIASKYTNETEQNPSNAMRLLTSEVQIIVEAYARAAESD